MHDLREEEDQREDAEQAELCAGGKIHITGSRITANWKKTPRVLSRLSGFVVRIIRRSICKS